VDINESNRRTPTTPVPPAPITHPQVRAQGYILCCEFANSSVGRPLVGGAKEILRMSPCSPRDRKEPTNSLRNVRFLRTFARRSQRNPGESSWLRLKSGVTLSPLRCWGLFGDKRAEEKKQIRQASDTKIPSSKLPGRGPKKR
jgi:hypothetical protein